MWISMRPFMRLRIGLLSGLAEVTLQILCSVNRMVYEESSAESIWASRSIPRVSLMPTRE